jgi:hypothetical protein
VRYALPSIAFLALTACASTPAPVEEGEARLEVGTGTWRFEPLEDGQEVPMVRGAQGGWHVWVSVRAEHLQASTGRLEIEVQPADESAPPESASVGVQFDPPDADGMRSYLGWPAILSSPSCAVGETLRVHVTLTTSAGQQISAERYLVPAPGDFPPPPCTE